MLALLNVFGPFAVKLIGSWLEKRGADAETRKQYQAFMQAMQASGLITADLRSDYERQLEELAKPDPEATPEVKP